MDIGKHNQAVGKQGESIAAEFLVLGGYQILDRNVQLKYGEIDIIAQKESEIVFFEVKARRSQNYGRPCEVINSAKLQRLEKCAWLYLRKHHLEKSDWSIKLIEVYKDIANILEVII